MFGSDDEELRVGEDVGDERGLSDDAAGEFGGGADHWVDLALQALLGRVQHPDHVAEGGVGDDQQIDVATGVFLATRQRTEDQRQPRRRVEVAQDIGRARWLRRWSCGTSPPVRDRRGIRGWRGSALGCPGFGYTNNRAAACGFDGK